MSTNRNAQAGKENMQGCLNAESADEYACQHGNGDKNVLLFYYSGNPNFEGAD
jgi:hypothetical protein